MPHLLLPLENPLTVRPQGISASVSTKPLSCSLKYSVQPKEKTPAHTLSSPRNMYNALINKPCFIQQYYFLSVAVAEVK